MSSGTPSSPPERPRDPERARTAAERARKAERAQQTGKAAAVVEKTKEVRAEPKSAFRLLRISGRWLRDAFVDNYPIKFVALLLALSVFVLVQSDEDVEISVYVNVHYDVPEERVLVSEPVEQVRMTLSGSSRRIQQFDERSIERLHLDLKDRKSGEFYFNAEMFEVPEGLRVVAIAPPSTALYFEPRDEKEVPIEVRTVGEPASGHIVEDVRVSPERVTISGARSAVAGVDEVPTREIALDGRIESFVETLPLVIPRPGLEIEGESFVRVEVDISEEAESRPLGSRRVALDPEVGADAAAIAGFRVEPREVAVTLKGAAPELQQIDPADISVFVEVYNGDLEGGQARSARLEVRGVPEGLAADVAPDEVTLYPPDRP